MVRPKPKGVPSPTIDRHQVLGEVARGGVGIVLKGLTERVAKDLPRSPCHQPMEPSTVPPRAHRSMAARRSLVDVPLREGEVVRAAHHDRDGRVTFEGDMQEPLPRPGGTSSPLGLSPAGALTP